MKTNLNKITILMFFVISMVLISCGVSKTPDLTPEAKRKTINNMPEWVNNTPNSPGFKYSSASAISQDMQVAIDKATLGAVSNLAATMQSEMNSLVKRAVEETGLGSESSMIDQYSKAQEQIVTVSLKDYRVAKKEVQEELSNDQYVYRAYVLIEWDEGASNKRLLAKIKEDEQLYTLMRSTQLFDEMEKKVEAYRKRSEGKAN